MSDPVEHEKYLRCLPRHSRMAQEIIWKCVDEYGDVYAKPLGECLGRIERESFISGWLLGLMAGGCAVGIAWVVMA